MTIDIENMPSLDVVNSASEDQATQVATEEKVELPRREALRKAFEEMQENDISKKEDIKEEVQKPHSIDVEPPSEFSEKGKKAWKEGNLNDIKEEYMRLHKVRTQEVSRIQSELKKESERNKFYKDMSVKAAPYIEMRAKEGVTPEQAIMETLSIVNHLKSSDAKTIKKELSEIGINLDSDDIDNKNFNSTEIKDLQTKINQLLEEREVQKNNQITGIYYQAFESLANEKNARGEALYPDLLSDGAESIELAEYIGSLTRNPDFIKGVQKRIPNADFKTLVVEAYKHGGGKVSLTAANTNKVSDNSNLRKRASASLSSNDIVDRGVDSQKGKLSRRDSLLKAMMLENNK